MLPCQELKCSDISWRTEPLQKLMAQIGVDGRAIWRLPGARGRNDHTYPLGTAENRRAAPALRAQAS